ncbi:MAG: DMT family transporter [Bdellovibrionaceae bacterium]|nr:DMT family transporter [Pseudobdellovibrionaceae bacterium]
MMVFYYGLPLTLGILIVLQGGLNRQIGAHWGLGAAVLLNAGILFAVSALFYGILRWNPEWFPEFLRPRSQVVAPSWWYLIPGVCGFCLVLGLPWSIQSIGSAKSFILVITAQICAGLVWDAVSTGVTPGVWKLIGGALTLLGSLFVIFG